MSSYTEIGNSKGVLNGTHHVNGEGHQTAPRRERIVVSGDEVTERIIRRMQYVKS